MLLLLFFLEARFGGGVCVCVCVCMYDLGFKVKSLWQCTRQTVIFYSPKGSKASNAKEQRLQ